MSADSNWQIAQIKSLANLQVDVNKHKPVHEVHEWVIFEHLNAHCSKLSSAFSEMWILKLESYFSELYLCFLLPYICPNVPHLFTFTYFQPQGMASILFRNIWRARYTSGANCTRNTVFVCIREYTNKLISEHICWGKNDNERTEKTIRVYSYSDLNMHKCLILFASYSSTK